MPRVPERRFLLILLALAALLAGAVPGRAYNAGKERWTAGEVTMHLQLGPANVPLADGTPSWGEVAESALALWNNQLTNLRFTVVRDGQVVYLRTAGERVAGSGEQIDADTLFKIASNSKAMTAGVLARLEPQCFREEGARPSASL